jgi:arylsulfatase A-like enzyme
LNSVRTRLLLVFAALALACDDAAEPPAAGPPNIVLIVLDDLAYEDLGAYGSREIETPELDRLAAEGTRFTQYYASSPVCSPTRAAMLTGLEPARLGLRQIVRRSSQRGIPARIPTLSQLLRDAGLATAHIGKWHLGTRRPEFLPLAKGFDRSVRRRPTNEAEKNLYTHYELLYDERSSRSVSGERHLTEDLTNEALRVLREAHSPFFLNLWYWAPHTPLSVPHDYDNSTTRYDLSDRRGRYAAMVSNVDRQIGRILAALDELELRDHTLVLVTSDNGGAQHAHAGGRLRGGKSTLYEGGIRVPLIARWPGRVTAGRIDDSLLASIDLLPTLAEIVGRPLTHRVTGRSFVAALVDGQQQARQGPLYFEAKRSREYFEEPLGRYVSYAVRDQQWKLVFGAEGSADARPQLYDVISDPGETADLARQQPDVVARLDLAYQAWRRQVGNLELEATVSATGRRRLGPDPALDIHDGDFSFAVELGPDPADTPGAERQVLAERAGSWLLTLDDQHIVLSLWDETGAHRELRSEPIDRRQTHWVDFTIFQWKKSPSTLRLYVDGDVADEAMRALGPILSSDEPIVLGAAADGTDPFRGELGWPRISLLCLEPAQVSSWQGSRSILD